MDIDWPAEFGRWLDRLEAEAAAGDQRSRTILAFAARALVFYDGVAARGDPMIDQWKRETGHEEKP